MLIDAGMKFVDPTDCPGEAVVRTGVAVLVRDACPDRRRRLAALLTAASPLVRVSEQGEEGQPAPGAWAIAVVALDQAMEPVLVATNQLRAAGIPVIGYGSGCKEWSLSRRCQALLAGIPTLLDADQADFDRLLAEAVSNRVQSVAGQRVVDHRLAAVVAELEIVGDSPALKSALLAIERSARLSEMPVLLLGESGAGKELMARAVHQLDARRRAHPFVAVNCAALTRSLAEAELFGHRKGAYSGAHRERPGLVRAAAPGVLFLDEIGELDLELQAKLLRVIQERRVLTLGDTQEISVDVRIVAATNRDLKALVQQGRFREDLLNRLWVYPVEIPPLRRRREDVQPLVQFFLRKYARGPVPVTAGSDFLEALGLAELPGNVRQLESIIQRAVVLAHGQRPLGLAELPPELWAELAERLPGVRALGPAGEGVDDRERSGVGGDLHLGRALRRHERSLVQAAMDQAGGNQTRAAKLLGITARSMYTKLRKHRLGRRASASSSP
jgi:transcriptional regulator with PAS, ATPase and Fis domain